ncbi:hypothetical protein ACP70R_022479 [Stipagrostis hirtigluma subsp. patula]
MKRRGGDDGGRTTMLEAKDAETMTGATSTTEMEELCSKLLSLVPPDYLPDNSQGSSDLPSQLMQATTYIEDLRERVQKLKQKRDDYYAKILQVTKCSCSNTPNEVPPEYCSKDAAIQSNAAHFDVNVTMNSEKCVELQEMIRAIEQDQCIEIVKASSRMVEDGKMVYTIKCRATSSEVVLDAPMVATRLQRLFTESIWKN